MEGQGHGRKAGIDIEMARIHTDEQRIAHLLARTTKTESGCMEFNGCVQSNGYSRATVRRKTDYAHRHIYRLIKGEIPSGMDVCHSCDNRKCINPDHLFLGTRRENMQDAVKKGRQAKGARLPQTILGEQDRSRIVADARSGRPYKEIAREIGICRQHVGKIAIENGIRRNNPIKGSRNGVSQ